MTRNFLLETDATSKLFAQGNKKSGSVLDEKNVKITTQSYAYKGHASAYIVDILNFFNLELQLKDSKFAIKNKLID